MAVHKLPSPIPAPYAIERGVPVPRRPGKSYPFAQMQVGDSITVRLDDAARVVGAARGYGTYHGWRFSVRRAADHVRLWRVA